MNSEFSFYLTDAQKYAMRDVNVDLSELHFRATGSVVGIVWSEYDVTTYTFHKDGSIVKEMRWFASGDGWETDFCNIDGVWTSEVDMLQ